MTKEEILKKHIDKYRKIKIVNEVVVATVEQSILEAMEEHAKDEAIGFYNWINKNGLVCFSGYHNAFWSEYQKSKTK